MKKILVRAGIVLAVLLVTAAGLAVYIYHALNVEGEYFDSNGVRINYFVKGEGTSVILVHGLAINAEGNWMAPGIFQRLAKKYRVIAFDNRGHGRSDKPYDPGQYGTEMVEDIIRLMDHLDIQKAHVVGYSMGGFIVLKLIAMHPDRLLSAAPCGAGWAANPEKDLALLDQVADDLDRGEGFKRLLEFLEPTGQKPSKARVAAANAAMLAINDTKAVAAVMRSIKQLQVTEAELRANTVPTLAVIGEKDPLKVYADQMAAVMSNLQLVVAPGGNHMTTLRKKECTAALDRFLAEHSPPADNLKTATVAFPGRRQNGVIPAKAAD